MLEFVVCDGCHSDEYDGYHHYGAKVELVHCAATAPVSSLIDEGLRNISATKTITATKTMMISQFALISEKIFARGLPDEFWTHRPLTYWNPGGQFVPPTGATTWLNATVALTEFWNAPKLKLCSELDK